MNQKNNIYYATVNNRQGYGNQYRIIKENNTYIIQVLTIKNNECVWENINLDLDIKFNNYIELISYIAESVEKNVAQKHLPKKKILSKTMR